MRTYAVVVRVTLLIDAGDAEMALALAQQAVRSAMWVEDYQWMRLREVDGANGDTVGEIGAGDAGRAADVFRAANTKRADAGEDVGAAGG